jgi:hypothetical protein
VIDEPGQGEGAEVLVGGVPKDMEEGGVVGGVVGAEDAGGGDVGGDVTGAQGALAREGVDALEAAVAEPRVVEVEGVGGVVGVKSGG